MRRLLGRIAATAVVWAAIAALSYFWFFYLYLPTEMAIIVIIAAVYAIHVTIKIWSRDWPSPTSNLKRQPR
jgi:hypothetical protein